VSVPTRPSSSICESPPSRLLILRASS
jgi:hypothetical protein